MGRPGSFHLLIVEDNPADVRLMKEALRQWTTPHCIHVADDGIEALDYLLGRVNHFHAPRPDMVILDLNLPKRSGIEVLCDMKSDESLRAIPVVVFSSSTSESDVNRAYECNANCYIAKPIDLDGYFSDFLAIERFWAQTATLPRSAAPARTGDSNPEGAD